MYIFVSENQVFLRECSNSKVEGGELDVRVVRRQQTGTIKSKRCATGVQS